MSLTTPEKLDELERAARESPFGDALLELVLAARREADMREQFSLPSVRKMLAAYRPLVERDGYVNWDALARYIAIGDSEVPLA